MHQFFLPENLFWLIYPFWNSTTDEPQHFADAKRGPKSGKNSASGQSAEASKKENDGKLKENTADKDGSKKKGGESKQALEKEGNDIPELTAVSAATETDGSAKSVKKKVIKRIVKQKTSNKKDDLETTQKVNDKVDGKETGDGSSSVEIASTQVGASANPPVKTFIRKRIIKKVPVGKTPKDDGSNPPDVKTVKEAESSEDKGNSKTDGNSSAVKQDAVVKKTVKRKIIKRVPKRKAASTESNNGVSGVDSIKDDVKEEKSVQAESEVQNVGDNNVENTENMIVVKQEQKVSPKTKSKVAEVKQETKEEKRTEELNLAGSKKESEADKNKSSLNDDHPKLKGKVDSKERTEKKDQDGKNLSKSKSSKEIKEKRSEDPPRHPGFFLQTKGSKDMKVG